MKNEVDWGFDLIPAAARADFDAFAAMTEWMLSADPTVLPIENAKLRDFLIKDGVPLKPISNGWKRHWR